MKKLEILDSFGLDSLRMRDVELRERRPGEVHIRVRANSLNYRDLMMIRGEYNPRQPLPLVPLSDGVGEIVAAPKDNPELIGKRVAGLFAQTWMNGPLTKDHQKSTLGGPRDGWAQTDTFLPVSGILEVPSYLSDEEAATLPCAALTAFSALFVHSHIDDSDTVLCLGTGGVSIFALQFAKAVGARVIITSSSDEKLERARGLGADHTINYRKDPAWEKTARKLSGGAGVSHVVEVGGLGTLERSISAVKPSGTISLIGVLSGADHRPNLLAAVMKQVRIQGIFVGHRDGFVRMCEFLETHQIRPVVDRVFDAAEYQDAFRYVEQKTHFGKVALRW